MARMKFKFGKIIGLSVLVMALAVGVALTQQNQNFKEKASEEATLANQEWSGFLAKNWPKGKCAGLKYSLVSSNPLSTSRTMPFCVIGLEIDSNIADPYLNKKVTVKGVYQDGILVVEKIILYDNSSANYQRPTSTTIPVQVRPVGTPVKDF